MRSRVVIVVLLAGMMASPLRAQDTSGSTGSAVAGGILGAYSGALSGGVLSNLLCDNESIVSDCWKPAMITGGALGAGTGVWLGLNDSDGIRGAGRGAGIGAAAGALTGTFLEYTGIRQSDTGPAWLEGALFVAAVGTVIGAVVSGGEGNEGRAGQLNVAVRLSVPLW